jgi:hypothetical protein
MELFNVDCAVFRLAWVAYVSAMDVLREVADVAIALLRSVVAELSDEIVA